MDRIKIGVVGLNFGGAACDMIANQGGKPYFQLTAVCDFDAYKGDRWRDENGAVIYTDYDEMLAKADMEAIVVMTGPNGRAEMIRKALRAGKHVMTTKPFEMDPEAAMSVLKEAESLGKVVYVNSPSPAPSLLIRQIKEWQEKYNLGKPIGYRYDVWSNYREKPDGRWYDDPKLCPAAPMLRLGIYLMNDMVRIFDNPVQVSVTQSRIFTQRPTADNTQMTVLFESGAIGSHFASFCVRDAQPYRQPLIINFENGTITSNVEPNTGETGVMTISATVNDDSERRFHREVERVEGYDKSGDYQWDILYRSIKGEKIEGLVTKEEIVNAVRILNAMGRASQSGLPEKV